MKNIINIVKEKQYIKMKSIIDWLNYNDENLK